MSFLAPLWLLLAAAAAVPLVLHLMRRRVSLQVEFPAARYLRRAEKEFSARMRLRNLLLMLLRILALLLIAVAAARPVTRIVAGGHPPTALAIVVDNSMSTGAVAGGESVLHGLVAQADAVLAESGADDRLWLVTADGSVRAGSASDLRAELAELRPIDGAGSMPDALTRAAAMLPGAGLPARQVLVFTDGQASAWQSPVRLPDAVLTVYAAPVEPPANRAVVAATAQPSRWTPRGAVAARLATTDSASWRITLDDRTLARGSAQAGEELLVRFTPSERGWLAGRVELQPDELRADDARHYAVWVGEPVGVAVRADAGPFAASAVDALIQSERVRVGVDVAVGSADQVGRLPALLLAPSEPGRLAAANRALVRLGVPWRFEQARGGRAPVRGERGEGATATTRYDLRPEPGAQADTILHAGSDAWAVAGDGYVLLGSPLDLQATDFPVRAAFVPWMGDVLTQRLGVAGGALIEASPAEPVQLPGAVTGLESPDGSTIAVSGQITAPAGAGVYFLLRGTDRIGALVVNPEEQESVLHVLSPEELRERFSARDLVVTGDAATARARAWSAGGGRSATGWLLALALGLLVAESVVSRSTGRASGRG